VDLDAGVLEDVAEPLDLRRPRLYDLGAVPDDVPGGLDVGGRDEAAPQQPALQQVHQPVSIGKIRLASRHVLDMPGVAHQHLLEVPVLEQRVVDGHTVDPGGLHRHVRDPQRVQPPSSLAEYSVERLERALVRHPAIRPATAITSLPTSTAAHRSYRTCMPASRARAGDKDAHAARGAPEMI